MRPSIVRARPRIAEAIETRGARRPEQWAELPAPELPAEAGRATPRAGKIPGVPEATCLECGTLSTERRGAFCRRCGLPYGTPPRSHAELPACPVCYRAVDDDGRLPSLERRGTRVDLVRHQAEHDRNPVGDDDWLESLREGDRIRIGRWTAPFETVRRYLVTGQVEAGRNRTLAHDAIVTAMTQLRRWGPAGVILGDQPEWAAARAAVVELMERYTRGRG